MLYLLGFDLLTGVFTLAPLALIDRRPGVTVAGVLRNWWLVFVGNFSGSLLVAVCMAVTFTFGFSESPNAVGQKIGQIGEARTVGYAAHGFAGMLTLFIRAVMCNWMVSTGVVGAMVSTSVSGKVIAMWMPILVFFYMGFEHSVVNMFLFPSGLMLGGKFTLTDYFLWNEIPTVIGNLIGGLTAVGLPLYATHYRTSPSSKVVATREVAVAERRGREGGRRNECVSRVPNLAHRVLTSSAATSSRRRGRAGYDSGPANGRGADRNSASDRCTVSNTPQASGTPTHSQQNASHATAGGEAAVRSRGVRHRESPLSVSARIRGRGGAGSGRCRRSRPASSPAMMYIVIV